MRKLFLLPAALFGLATPATAQVTVDLRALDALPSASPARSAPNRPPAPAARAEPTAPPPSTALQAPASARLQATPSPAPAAGPATPAPAPSRMASAQPAAPVVPASPPMPTVDAAPPPVAQLSAIAPPPPPSAGPPPPPIEAKAATTAAATESGVRITFAAGQADLSPSSADAIKQLVASAHSGATTTFNVVAYAAAVTDDPSAARRLSLSRALAVRAALMADGVESSRIFVRALGSQVPEGPPDRVDLTLFGGNAR